MLAARTVFEVVAIEVESCRSVLTGDGGRWNKCLATENALGCRHRGETFGDLVRRKSGPALLDQSVFDLWPP